MAGKVLQFPARPRKRPGPSDPRSEVLEQIAMSALLLEKAYDQIDAGGFETAREYLDAFDCPPLQKLHGAAVAWLNEVEPQ